MVKREMKIVSKDSNGNEYTTTMPFQISTDTSKVTYSVLDQVGRKFVNLTRNTYVDTLIVQTVSVNEELG